MMPPRALLTLTLLLAALCALAADPIVGRWRILGSSDVVDIRPADVADEFVMLWVDGDDCSIMPGTVVGRLTAAPAPGLYDCRMPIDPTGDTNPKVWEATVTISPSDPYTFTFGHYERRNSLNVRNLLPRWLRVSVSRKDSRPNNLDGARRVDSPPRFVSL